MELASRSLKGLSYKTVRPGYFHSARLRYTNAYCRFGPKLILNVFFSR